MRHAPRAKANLLCSNRPISPWCTFRLTPVNYFGSLRNNGNHTSFLRPTIHDVLPHRVHPFTRVARHAALILRITFSTTESRLLHVFRNVSAAFRFASFSYTPLSNPPYRGVYNPCSGLTVCLSFPAHTVLSPQLYMNIMYYLDRTIFFSFLISLILLSH